MIINLATLTLVATVADVFCRVFDPVAWLRELIVVAIGKLIAYIVNAIAYAVGDLGSVAKVAVDPDENTTREEDHPTIALEGRLICNDLRPLRTLMPFIREV